LDNKKEQDEIISWIEDLEYNILWLPKPDKIIFLDMHIDIAWKLNEKRWWGSIWRDIHEKNYEYMKKAYFRAIDIAKRKWWIIITCYENDQPKTLQQIHENIKLAIH
jgi:dTMP kinase